MMTRDPYARFAKYYDMLYERKKGYAAEVRQLLRLFDVHGQDVRSVLDLGCGTGGHALPLAKKGYEVVGIDRTRAMLEIGRNKARKLGLDVPFVQGNMSSFTLGRRFDAVICMFGGWGYLLTDREVSAAIRRVRRHLNPGGLFLIDFWGLGGARHFHRWWDFARGDCSLVRWTESSFDKRTRRLSIMMHHLTYRGNRVIDEFTERHVLRTYRLLEMRKLLTANGFQVKALIRFEGARKRFTASKPKDFHVMAVAVAR